MRTILYAFLLVSTTASALFAQTAELAGRVTDPTGSVIIGASVVATNVATGVTRETVTTDAGYYALSNLPPGTYNVSVKMTGFTTSTQNGVRLAVQQAARLDFGLQLGNVTESVQVTAEAEVIESSNAAIGMVVDNKRVVDLPLKGRQFLDFALLGPGVNGGRPGDPRASQQGIAISANGLYTKNNNFMLDGADNNESYQNQFAISPSVDAVEEFKVQTGLYSAEYGRGGGAMVSIVTKSGTNDFHGVLFEFLRNDVFDARNFFARSTDAKPPLRRNQFGGSIGGPIIRNRTFFFANFDGTRQRRRSVVNQVVPTEANRNGDLSSFAAPVLDPLTKTPFPGNVIPSGRISPVSLNLLKFWPMPNQPAGARTNYYASLPIKTDVNSGVMRLDHRFGSGDSVYGRYAINTLEDAVPGASPLAGGRRADEGAHGAAINWVHLFSPTMLNVATVSYNRFRQDGFGQNQGTPVAAQAGITGIADNPRDVGFPESIAFSTGTGFMGLGEMSTRIRRMTTYQVQNTTTMNRGAHTLKFGGDFRIVQANVLQTSALQGSFNFNGQYTGGNAFAEFLLGIPATTQTSINAGLIYPRRKSGALFIQDDWRATPALTLNLGLRYEVNMPITEARHQLSAFDHQTGEIVFPKDADLGDFYTNIRPDIKYRRFDSNTLYDTDLNNFGPRIGLAWRPFESTKTVLRSGFGVYFLSPELNSEQNTGNSPPFQLRIDATGNREVPDLSWNLGGNTQFLKTAQFGIFTFNAARNFRNGYVMQWMAEVQREIAGSWVAKVGYVANKGVRLDTHVVRNQLPPGPGATATRRIFPLFARIRSYESDGWSNYHSLQSTLEKRFSHGFTLFSSYTWSKAMDFGWTQDICCPQDVNNFAAENALASHDQRHRLTTNALYELPFGRGRRFGSNLRGIGGKLAEGWRAGVLATFATGMPANPSVGGNPDNVPDNNDRPDRLGNGNLDQPTLDGWWDRSAFARQPLYQFGNSGRNVLTAPGTKSGNLVLSKSTTLTESQRLEFRAEFFNFTNTPNFGTPTAEITNPNFGKVLSAGSPREMQFGLKYYF